MCARALQVQGTGHQGAWQPPGSASSPPARLGPSGRVGRRMCLEGSVFKTRPQVSEAIRMEARRRVEGGTSPGPGEAQLQHPPAPRAAEGAPAAPKLPRDAGPGGPGVGETLEPQPSTRGASPRFPPDAPLPQRPYLGPPAARGRQAAAAAAGPGATGRRAPWGGGRRSGQRRGGGGRAARAPSSGRASAANAGPRPRGSIIPPRRRARRRRGQGAPAPPPPRPLPARDLGAPSLLASPRPAPAARGPRAGERAGTLELLPVGSGEGGRFRSVAPPPPSSPLIPPHPPSTPLIPRPGLG